MRTRELVTRARKRRARPQAHAAIPEPVPEPHEDEENKTTNPPLTLKRWPPADRSTDTVTLDAEPPTGTLLVDIDHRMANQRNLVTLHRAAEVNGLLDSMFEADTTLRGHAWYDRLPRITAMDTEAVVDGEKMTFTWTDEAPWNDELQQIVAALGGQKIDEIGEHAKFEIGENALAEFIVVRILVRTEYETQCRRLRTDFGVGTEFTTSVHDAGILVTRDCALDIEGLKKLIGEAVFQYSRDGNEDSAHTQWRCFVEEAHTAAARLLLHEQEATEESIRHAARTHLGHLLPDGRTVELRKTTLRGTDHCDVGVRLLPETPPKNTTCSEQLVE